jgi:hypothetical protein
MKGNFHVRFLGECGRGNPPALTRSFFCCELNASWRWLAQGCSTVPPITAYCIVDSAEKGPAHQKSRVSTLLTRAARNCAH